MRYDYTKNYFILAYETNTSGDIFTVTLHCEDEYGDVCDKIFTYNLSELAKIIDDEDAFEAALENTESSSPDYEELGIEFYHNAEEKIEQHFGCTGAYLEPSTQLGQGRTFLFADDMAFDGSFDYQTGEEYIRDNDFDGFLALCLSSFKPRKA